MKSFFFFFFTVSPSLFNTKHVKNLFVVTIDRSQESYKKCSCQMSLVNKQGLKDPVRVNVYKTGREQRSLFT